MPELIGDCGRPTACLMTGTNSWLKQFWKSSVTMH